MEREQAPENMKLPADQRRIKQRVDSLLYSEEKNHPSRHYIGVVRTALGPEVNEDLGCNHG